MCFCQLHFNKLQGAFFDLLTLPDEWEVQKLEKVAEIVIGGTPRTDTPAYWHGDIKWVTAKDISECQTSRIYDTERKISELGLLESSAKILPPQSTVLIARGATMGKSGLLVEEMALNQTCYGIVAKPHIEPQYLFYCIQQLEDNFRNISHGTIFNTVIGSSLAQVEIPLPPLPEQHRIAHILGSLDDKIELNRQMNATLEAIARAIFKSWFVDFDPVWAKSEGRDPGLPEEIAALFPDGFEESALGVIPAGWGASIVGQEFDLTMGQSPPGETYNEDGEGIPFYQGRRDFGFRFPSLRVYCTAPTRFASAGDTLVSVRAPVGDVNMAIEDCSVGRGVAAIRHVSGSRSYTYYSMLSLGEQFDRFEAEGTVFGSIGGQDFRNLLFIRPSEELVMRFEEIAYSLDQSIENNERQSRTLAELRDTLLPKLISGKIRVGEQQ